MLPVRQVRRRKVPYAGLTNIQLQISALGLETGVNNSYGTVDGSDVITAVKSGPLAGPTGRDFSVVGSGVTFDPVTKSLVFNGSGRLRCGAAASVFDFLHFAGSIGLLEWSIFVVLELTNLATVRAILGNNAGSSTQKGAVLGINGGSSVNALFGQVTRGSGGNYVGQLAINATAQTNKFFVFTVQMDGSGVIGTSRMRFFINDQPLLYVENTDNNSTMVATASNALEIGGAGNSALPFIGKIKEVIITSDVTPLTQVLQSIRGLMNAHRIEKSNTSFFNNTTVTQIVQVIDDSKYHLQNNLCQNPVNPDICLSVYNTVDQHSGSLNAKFVGRKHLNIRHELNALNPFGSEFTIADPAGNEYVRGCGVCYDPSGRLHFVYSTGTSLSAGGVLKLYYMYSDDDGTTFSAATDITSAVPSDGLTLFQPYGNMIYNDGALLMPYYKQTDIGNITNSALYCLKSTDLGANWASKTVKASSGTYRNEMDIVALSSTDLYGLVRDEVTLEWHCYTSSDNGENWTDQGAVNFGETITSANPLRVKSFTHKGVKVIACYYTDRNNDVAKVIYATAAGLLSNPITGWDSDTKFIWWKTALAPWHYHYGDVLQVDDTGRGVGMYSYDTYPGSGGGTSNRIHYIEMPTWQLRATETELGI